MQYCTHCNLYVAPQQPGKIVIGKNLFHPECFKKHLAKNNQLPLKIQQEQVLQVVAVSDPFLPSGEWKH
jgi:hypothetical protein